MKKILSSIIAILIATLGLLTVSASYSSSNVIGDTNGDSKITITDATLVQKHIAKLTAIEEDRLAYADVDGNNKISITDATFIQKKLAKIISLFPAETIETTEPIVPTTETQTTATEPSYSIVATEPSEYVSAPTIEPTEDIIIIPTTSSVPTEATETITSTEATEDEKIIVVLPTENTWQTEATETPTQNTEPTETFEPTTEATEPTETVPATFDENVLTSQYTPNEMELTILEIINQHRAEVGVDPLEFGYFYYDCARTRAEEGNRFFSHTRPNGTAWQTVLQEYGIDYTIRYAGENIAQFYPDAESVMMGFMNSPGHRENILREEFDYVAIAVYESEEYPGNYTVEQLFTSKKIRY